MEDQTQATEAATSQPELSITDLQNLRAIVETAARRGAFAAQEMTAVGAVFDRLNAFLTAVAPTPATTNDGAEQTPSA